MMLPRCTNEVAFWPHESAEQMHHSDRHEHSDQKAWCRASHTEGAAVIGLEAHVLDEVVLKDIIVATTDFVGAVRQVSLLVPGWRTGVADSLILPPRKALVPMHVGIAECDTNMVRGSH